MQKNLLEQIDELICLAKQEQELTLVIPILEEIRRVENGPRFDSDDIERMAGLITGLGDGSSGAALDRASGYAKKVGPNMFARALLAELTRRASEE